MSKWLGRQQHTETPDLLVTPTDWDVDDPSLVEDRLRLAHFGSWESVIACLAEKGIRVREIADMLLHADPDMYADLHLQGMGLDANAMRKTGGIRMGSAAIIAALIRLAQRMASLARKSV